MCYLRYSPRKKSLTNPLSFERKYLIQQCVDPPSPLGTETGDAGVTAPTHTGSTDSAPIAARTASVAVMVAARPPSASTDNRRSAPYAHRAKCGLVDSFYGIFSTPPAYIPINPRKRASEARQKPVRRAIKDFHPLCFWETGRGTVGVLKKSEGTWYGR